MKACAIANRGRHRNHRITHQSANHARQCALHASHRHHAVRPLQNVHLIQQAMNSAHAHIIYTHNLRAEKLRCLRSLLRHRNICRACRADGHAAYALLIRTLILQRPRHSVIFNLRQHLAHQLILLRRSTRAVNLAMLGKKTLINAHQKFIRLIAAIDNLGKAGADFAIGVQLGIAKVFIGLMLKKALGLLDGHCAAAHLFEYTLRVHFTPPSMTKT